VNLSDCFVKNILIPMLVLACALGHPSRADESYAHSIESWWAERAVRLTKADGWLTLIGLHYLREGGNTVGRSAENTIVLAAGPARIGTVVLDFNLATNPPCAFTPFATCPLPPKQNHLAIAVAAGEKAYRGAHK